MSKQILEGSHAIAQVIRNIKPGVVSAYPITPQTHIVEDLAEFIANGEANYEYIKAESEFAAASIVEGAQAAGCRTYTATSSQGLLLMLEVIYNIAGMRLPVVMTLANRGVSAPITIWNDHQDAMSARDTGWIMLFAENHQEAVNQHILAYKVGEKLRLPVIVNIDGFLITHSYEGVLVPEIKDIKKYLPNYNPKSGEYLDPENPVTLGAFASPEFYLEIRESLHKDLVLSQGEILNEYEEFKKVFAECIDKDKKIEVDNGLIEYYGNMDAEKLLICMGSVAGTVKETIKDMNNVALLKIRAFRPFPKEEILKNIEGKKEVIILEKAISLGFGGILASEIKSLINFSTKVKNPIIGLGGRDVTCKMIKEIIDCDCFDKEIFVAK